MNKRDFLVEFRGTTLVGDIISESSQPALLCLHGAKPANRQRFDELRELLAQQSVASCTFDFIGHGDTGGDLFSSSLEDRLEQVLVVIKSQRLSQPLSIIASSMSGHVAIKLTKLCAIENLILLAPAVYASGAYTVPFGPRFTETIRRPYSWRDSDAWKILESYKGNLLIFAAKNDRVIPDEVIERIYNSAKNVKSREVVTIENATHPLGKWLNEHSSELREVSSQILKLSQTS